MATHLLTHDELLQSIADRIADYRRGEISPRTPQDIDRWVRQFAKAAQHDILAEMDHVISKVYFSRKDCKRFLRSVAELTELVGPAPAKFWKNANFLRIQQKGESQRVMFSLFGPVLQKATGFGVERCGSPDGPFVYLDDCYFTGTHIRWDLLDWIKNAAPKKAQVHVIVLATHDGRVDYTTGKVSEGAAASKKNIDLTWWSAVRLRDNSCRGETDCLLPTSFPKDTYVQHLLQQMEGHGFPARPRDVGTTPENQVFSSEARRSVLEQEFLKAGVRIKYDLCPHLQENQWPLGYDVFKCVGFGSLVVTFRNCPNNCPLALWAGNPWVPLFPRKTNTQAATEGLFFS